VTGLKLPEGGMLPKAGLFAELEGEIVADRILALLGKGQAREFDGKGYCYFEAGGGQAMKVQGEFFKAPMDRVQLEPPSTQAFKDKQAFERERLEKWFN
jgi:sulfide:quinone oxidoreductase